MWIDLLLHHSGVALKNDEGKESDIAVQDGAGYFALNLTVDGLMQERDLRLSKPPMTYWRFPIFLSLKHRHFNAPEPNAPALSPVPIHFENPDAQSRSVPHPAL